jgi:DNA-binding transcriptional LysR family regulator
MRRRINLRQIELFKAVIEQGTVSSAAAALNVSQPAVSKTLAQLEADCELRLFDRVRGRLAPTEQGMQLYAEIDRIFSGVQQVENAIDALHRQAHGRVLIGVMPGLSGPFVQRVVTAFLREHPATYCSIEARSSEWIMESLVGRRLDVGLLNQQMQSPFVQSDRIAEHALVCIMPLGHPLAAKRAIAPKDVACHPFVSFGPETDIGQQVSRMLADHGVAPTVSVATNIAPTVCEFVASGTGISLLHPLMISDFSRIVVRRFQPDTTLGFLLAHPRSSRNARLIDQFIKVARTTADQMVSEALAR